MSARVTKTDLPGKYRIMIEMFEGRRVYVPEHLSDGAWTRISWNKSDFQFIPTAIKAFEYGTVAFTNKSHAVVFILGWNWQW